MIKVKKIASDNDAHFELCFKYPLMRGYTLKELSRQNNKELQNFLDKVSHMTIQQVDTLYGRKPDRTDFYGGEKVYHYAVADAFRIHVVREDGYYKIIRLDPNHKVHKS